MPAYSSREKFRIGPTTALTSNGNLMSTLAALPRPCAQQLACSAKADASFPLDRVSVTTRLGRGWPGIADYSATKAAVAAYTRGWARDLAPKGITVNNVQPGPIDTIMNPASGE